MPLAAANRRHLSAGQYGREDEQPLLPGLPDHLAHLCLALVPPAILYSVCRRWRRLIYSSSFPPFLSLYAVVHSPCGDEPIGLYSYDPISAAWDELPSPPPNPPLRRLLLRHPSFIARTLPIQSVAASGHLVILAATTHHLLPALPRPLAFHPATRTWRIGPTIHPPRRWCAAGAAGGDVYVASGIGAEYSAGVARSAARWDPRRRGAAWEQVAPLKDGRFSREAVSAVACKGRKLCIANVKAGEGVMYDVALDRWEEMPPGMLAGWTGPAAAEEEEEGGQIYVIDEASGKLLVYEWERDSWATVATSERLKGAEAMAAGGGKVCVVAGGGEAVVVVDVEKRAGRMWVVDPPEGKRVLALHVLPRMNRDGC